jgi:hypothetical protein
MGPINVCGSDHAPILRKLNCDPEYLVERSYRKYGVGCAHAFSKRLRSIPSSAMIGVRLRLVSAIGITTLFRWMNEPQFKSAYLKARRESVSQAIARMQQATGAAGVTILKLMMDPNVPPAVKLRAAESVFSLAIKGIETEDIEARIAALERAAEESQKKK